MGTGLPESHSIMWKQQPHYYSKLFLLLKQHLRIDNFTKNFGVCFPGDMIPGFVFAIQLLVEFDT